MNHLPVSLFDQILSYVFPYHIELRHDINTSKIVWDIHDKSSITNYHHKQTVLPRVVLEDHKLYMIKGATRLYCSDFILANHTWVFTDGNWIECMPDDETMKCMLSCPDQLRLQYQKNPHPVIVEYLLQQPEKIIWHLFCMNRHDDAVEYCIQHADCINWVSFCKNTNKKAIDYMVQHSQHIDWYVFSQNPSIYLYKIDEILIQEWTRMLV